VATVFQDLLNVSSRSVVDNVLLGRPGWLRRSATRRQERNFGREQLARLGLADVDLDAPLGACSLPVQQLVAIARALGCSPRVLILDEATSALDVGSCEQLFSVLRQELTRNVLVLFISHRMEEVVSLADAVTVLANGVSVKSLTRSEISEEHLLDVMSVAGVAGRG
jgi:ribose transport system ATP-binding protein